MPLAEASESGSFQFYVKTGVGGLGNSARKYITKANSKCQIYTWFI